MKQIDIRYHFVQNLIEEGIVEIIFVESKENDGNVFTKNLGEELFKKHINIYMTSYSVDRKGVIWT